MKKDNKKLILMGICRIGLIFILSTCISMIFIYLLIGDDKVFETLFSSGKSAEIILLLSLIWVFGTTIGALIASVEFISILAQKNVQINDMQSKINRLQKKLNKVSKKSSNSFATRMFTEIESLSETAQSSPDDDVLDFKTLQEL